MAGQETMKATCKLVKPILSRDYCESHRQVMGLYRAMYRYIPYIVKYFDIPKSEQQCRWKLREYFYRNAFLTDLRVIDTLVIKVLCVAVCWYAIGAYSSLMQCLIFLGLLGAEGNKTWLAAKGAHYESLASFSRAQAVLLFGKILEWNRLKVLWYRLLLLILLIIIDFETRSTDLHAGR